MTSTQIPDFDFLTTSKLHYYHLDDNVLYKIFVSNGDLLPLYEILGKLNIRKYRPNIIKELVEINIEIYGGETIICLNIDNLELTVNNQEIVLSPKIINVELTKSNIYDVITIQLDISEMMQKIKNFV